VDPRRSVPRFALGTSSQSATIQPSVVTIGGGGTQGGVFGRPQGRKRRQGEAHGAKPSAFCISLGRSSSNGELRLQIRGVTTVNLCAPRFEGGGGGIVADAIGIDVERLGRRRITDVLGPEGNRYNSSSRQARFVIDGTQALFVSGDGHVCDFQRGPVSKPSANPPGSGDSQDPCIGCEGGGNRFDVPARPTPTRRRPPRRLGTRRRASRAENEAHLGSVRKHRGDERQDSLRKIGGRSSDRFEQRDALSGPWRAARGATQLPDLELPPAHPPTTHEPVCADEAR